MLFFAMAGLKTILILVKIIGTVLCVTPFTEIYKNENNFSGDSNREYFNDLGSKHFNAHYLDGLKNSSISLLELIVPDEEVDTSTPCIKDLRTMLHKIKKNMDIPSLRALDSWGKISSGILEGNLNQFGNFDQCVSDGDKEGDRIDFKYCLFSFEIKLSGPLEKFDDLIHSHYAIKSSQNDPSHRIPHFSSFHWGLCIPRSCSAKEIDTKLMTVAKQYLSQGVNISITGSDGMCQQKVTMIGKSQMILAGVCILTIFLVCLLMSMESVYAYIVRHEELKWLRHFSLRKNFESLTNVSDEDGIAMLDGARVLSALALLLSHKHMALLYEPFVNRTTMAKMIGHPWTIIGRTAIIYTDGFILISGFLTARTILKEYRRDKTINFKKIIISRLIRLTPSLLTIIIISTMILPEMNQGPLWNMVVKKHADLCKINWWKNMLYIHNYFGFENMCLTHTHQVGIDFQLFLLGIPLILYVQRTYNIKIMILLALMSTVLRFVVTYLNNLSVIIYNGISVAQLFDTANLSYILPTHRLTVYLMGVWTFFYLEKDPKKKINQPYLCIGWIIAGVSGMLAMCGPFHMSKIGYRYNATEAAFYNAFSPVLWGLLFVWTIITSVKKQAGWFGSMLEWPGFKILGKLTYSIYLIQFPVFFYNVGIIRAPRTFSSLDLFNIGEFTIIGILSLAMTLIIEMPFNNINRAFWKTFKKDEVKENVDQEVKNENPVILRKRVRNVGE